MTVLSVKHAPRGSDAIASNLLISGLPAAEQNRLKPFFEKVQLSDGEELVRAGEPIGSIWFIESAVIVTFQPLHNGRHIPAGLAGNDGVAGFELWLGRNLRLSPPSPKWAAMLCA